MCEVLLRSGLARLAASCCEPAQHRLSKMSSDCRSSALQEHVLQAQDRATVHATNGRIVVQAGQRGERTCRGLPRQVQW